MNQVTDCCKERKGKKSRRKPGPLPTPVLERELLVLSAAALTAADLFSLRVWEQCAAVRRAEAGLAGREPKLL